MIHERLTEFGINLPTVAPPMGNYVDRTEYVGGTRDAGRHTLAAVGMAELPFDIAVEIEMIASFRN